MEQSRIVGPDAKSSSSPIQEAAEKIVREAEGRSSGSGEKAPVHETTSSYLGMTRKEAPVYDAEPKAGDEAGKIPETREPSTAPVEDNTAPLSSALGIPTLAKDEARESSTAPAGDNPAPFSSALGIPTLINESKPER